MDDSKNIMARSRVEELLEQALGMRNRRILRETLASFSDVTDTVDGPRRIRGEAPPERSPAGHGPLTAALLERWRATVAAQFGRAGQDWRAQDVLKVLKRSQAVPWEADYVRRVAQYARTSKPDPRAPFAPRICRIIRRPSVDDLDELQSELWPVTDEPLTDAELEERQALALDLLSTDKAALKGAAMGLSRPTYFRLLKGARARLAARWTGK